MGSLSGLLSMTEEYSAKFIISYDIWYMGFVYALLVNGGVYSQNLIKEPLMVTCKPWAKLIVFQTEALF